MLRNDAITKANDKTVQIIHQSKGFDKSYLKTYFLFNLSDCVKSYGHYGQNFGLFSRDHSPNMIKSRYSS